MFPGSEFLAPAVMNSFVRDWGNVVSRFLERSGGTPSDDQLNNVRPDLRLELRTALFKAAQTERSVETRLRQQQHDGRQVFLNITVRPLQREAGCRIR